jgi:hypothetical protein
VNAVVVLTHLLGLIRGRIGAVTRVGRQAADNGRAPGGENLEIEAPGTEANFSSLGTLLPPPPLLSEQPASALTPAPAKTVDAARPRPPRKVWRREICISRSSFRDGLELLDRRALPLRR